MHPNAPASVSPIDQATLLDAETAHADSARAALSRGVDADAGVYNTVMPVEAGGKRLGERQWAASEEAGTADAGEGRGRVHTPHKGEVCVGRMVAPCLHEWASSVKWVPICHAY